MCESRKLCNIVQIYNTYTHIIANYLATRINLASIFKQIYVTIYFFSNNLDLL